jgi:hypothetical protein
MHSRPLADSTLLIKPKKKKHLVAKYSLLSNDTNGIVFINR